MTEFEENQSLDQLFHDSFQHLPLEPASNGWDQPSNKVWEQISNNLQPKGFQWTGLHSALLGTALLIAATSVYFLLLQPQTPAKIETPVSLPQPAIEHITTPAPAAETEHAVSDSKPAGKPNTPAKHLPASHPADANPSAPTNIQTPSRPSPNEATPLPGSSDGQAPNTLERLRQDSIQKARLNKDE